MVLDIYLHNPPNLALLDANYTVVHVNIGRYDQNQNLAARYNIPLAKGVPALAVLDSSGEPLYVQRNGEFEAMGKMDPCVRNRVSQSMEALAGCGKTRQSFARKLRP